MSCRANGQYCVDDSLCLLNPSTPNRKSGCLAPRVFCSRRQHSRMSTMFSQQPQLEALSHGPRVAGLTEQACVRWKNRIPRITLPKLTSATIWLDFWNGPHRFRAALLSQACKHKKRRRDELQLCYTRCIAPDLQKVKCGD